MKNYLGKQIYSSVFYPGLLVATMWLVFCVQHMYSLNVFKLGVLPRKPEALHGVITSVFVHGDWAHIASNTLPLLVLGTLLFYFYKKIAKATGLWIWLISGIWLWIGGRNSDAHPQYHIGASTLVYGLASFLFFSGVFRRHIPLMVVSALVVFLYGSLVWGVFPIQQGVSWEGHLFGALAGCLVAFSYRKEGPQRKVYVWENETDDTDDIDQDPSAGTDSLSYGQIRYLYRPGGHKDKDESSAKEEQS